MWGWSKKSPGVKKHSEIEHFPSGVGVDKMVKKSLPRSKDGEISKVTVLLFKCVK